LISNTKKPIIPLTKGTNESRCHPYYSTVAESLFMMYMFCSKAQFQITMVLVFTSHKLSIKTSVLLYFIFFITNFILLPLLYDFKKGNQATYVVIKDPSLCRRCFNVDFIGPCHLKRCAKVTLVFKF